MKGCTGSYQPTALYAGVTLMMLNHTCTASSSARRIQMLLLLCSDVLKAMTRVLLLISFCHYRLVLTRCSAWQSSPSSPLAWRPSGQKGGSMWAELECAVSNKQRSRIRRIRENVQNVVRFRCFGRTSKYPNISAHFGNFSGQGDQIEPIPFALSNASWDTSLDYT